MADALDRYRHYLLLLAGAQWDRKLGARLDASDIVQQTLMEAHHKREEFRGKTEAQRLAWLRRILANNLADAFKAMRRAKRDAAREVSLEAELAQSSRRLCGLLAAEQSSPSERASNHEQALRLARALASLPATQREALLAKHWHGKSLAETAGQLGRTPAAVAGLLRRAMKQLRTKLQEGA